LSGVERNYFDKIIKASNRMQILIEDVLLLSKLSDTGVSYEKVDLNEVIDRIIDDYEVSINEKSAVVIKNKLPIIEAIPGQMRQLFQNLISNALKFNDTGRPEIKISVMPGEQYGRGKEFVCIRVQDNGIGFQMEYKEKIFGIFQRLHTQQYSGSGIGLAICKKISDNHHGYIVPHSEPGKGSCFDVILPAKKLAAGEKKPVEMQLN
jgi:two-component system CheB/CheR fusion protein